MTIIKETNNKCRKYGERGILILTDGRNINILLKSIQRFLKDLKLGTGKMAQQLRVLAGLEDLGLIPSIHMTPHSHLYLQFQKM